MHMQSDGQQQVWLDHEWLSKRLHEQLPAVLNSGTNSFSTAEVPINLPYLQAGKTVWSAICVYSSLS